MKTIEELEKAYAEACISEAHAQAAFTAACPRGSACRRTPEQEALRAKLGVAASVTRDAHLDLHEVLVGSLRKAGR